MTELSKGDNEAVKRKLQEIVLIFHKNGIDVSRIEADYFACANLTGKRSDPVLSNFIFIASLP